MLDSLFSNERAKNCWKYWFVISSKFREFSVHRFLFIFVAIAAAERSASGSPSLTKVDSLTERRSSQCPATFRIRITSNRKHPNLKSSWRCATWVCPKLGCFSCQHSGTPNIPHLLPLQGSSSWGFRKRRRLPTSMWTWTVRMLAWSWPPRPGRFPFLVDETKC